MKGKENIRRQKGITLIALVVTIIILLILAGVAINAAIGDNGLFSKSRQSVEMHKEEAAREKISMALGEYILDINTVDMPDNEKDSYLLEILSKVGPTTEAPDPKYYETIVDGYVFWIDRDTLEIISKGKDGAEDATKITVKDTSKKMEIYVGQTVIIDVEIEPAGASTRDVEYTTSNESIATVANGVVTGVAEGTATITIKTKNGNTDTCEVEVKEIRLTDIEINPTSLEFTLGETETEQIAVTKLEPKDASNKTLVWTSSDENVATVDNKGNVTAVGTGTCTITVKSERYEEVQATCDVNVKMGAIKVNFKPNGSTEWKESYTVKLSTNINESEITETKYKWDNRSEGIEERHFNIRPQHSLNEPIESDEIDCYQYLWVMVKTKDGETHIFRSEVFRLMPIEWTGDMVKGVKSNSNDQISIRVYLSNLVEEFGPFNVDLFVDGGTIVGRRYSVCGSSLFSSSK